MAERTVSVQFEDADQQHDAAELGMWTFLVTEVMFFGGLLAGYAVSRFLHPVAFAEASGHLYRWIAAANTLVLLVSSWVMVLAVDAARGGRWRAARLRLALTATLGGGFLALKAIEYLLDWREGVVPVLRFAAGSFGQPGPAQLFFVFYFVMTGLHALHVTVGVAVLGAMAGMSARGWRNATAVEMAGLYWHFVDIVWIVLLPLLYLIR